jgi:hypothetical protein
MNNLENALTESRDYFKKREFSNWVTLMDESLVKLRNQDYSFVHGLWLKFGDTCDVDDLLITDYAEEDEALINKLNFELSEVAKNLFWMLDKIENENT